MRNHVDAITNLTLLDNWRRRCLVSDRWFADILRHHAAVGRVYHNVSHLVTMLEHVNFFLLFPNYVEPFDADLVAKAILTHDVIMEFRPGARNEERSAEYARTVFNLTREIEPVCEMILATKDHTPRLGTAEERVFLDIDLCMLSVSPDYFVEFEIDVRREWSAYSDADYRKGRTAVLTGFLDRAKAGTLYRTAYFQDRTARAVANLEQAIAALA